MKKPEITEGEWVVEMPNDDMGIVLVNTKDELTVHDGFHLADAKAISAVPEMMDALIGLCFLNQCELGGLQSGQPTADQWREAFEKAEEALKKAGVEL